MELNQKQEELFNYAYRNYANMILNVIKMYIKDDKECEDILQEVFLTLLIKEPKFENQEHEKHWLIRVAINKSRDYHRSFWKRKIEITDRDILSNNTFKEIDVKEYINNLPGLYKEVVLLYYFFGYSIKEIASILNLRESAVKMRLSRARKKMQIEMEGKYD